ncbi:MAG: signal peptidase II [Alphaproteobacteria bacterium]|nr:signal peptidase II [Alphaproteobacteria bacterium]
MRRGGRGFALAAAVLAADQATKAWAIDYLAVQAPLGRGRVEPVTDFFNLVVVWNRGVSFGLFQADAAITRWGLAAIALAVAVGLSFWLVRARHGLVAAALGLIIGGALGNVVDRVRFGAVFDFLDFHAMGYHWPAFNIADAGISVGVAALLIDGLFGRREGHR